MKRTHILLRSTILDVLVLSMTLAGDWRGIERWEVGRQWVLGSFRVLQIGLCSSWGPSHQIRLHVKARRMNGIL